jgi:spermidine/putrescine transport system substrate-binding protein
MKSWNALSNPVCERKITAKDNVRDSYFMGLGMYYEEELLALKAQYESGTVSRETYKNILNEKMNDTSIETMNGVKKKLETMRKNLYGLETDEGKLDVIMGRLDASFQWSGDAVYIIDEAEINSENDEHPLLLEYSIPESASNLWFDGWVMMNNANVEAATAFVNFLSMPINVIRNMYYIGYTSCIGGDEVFSYIEETYGSDDENENLTEYDLSYFFGENHLLTTTVEQTRRQLFAQYPDASTIDRLVVMKYFDKETNTRANRMWNNIK